MLEQHLRHLRRFSRAGLAADDGDLLGEHRSLERLLHIRDGERLALLGRCDAILRVAPPLVINLQANALVSEALLLLFFDALLLVRGLLTLLLLLQHRLLVRLGAGLPFARRCRCLRLRQFLWSRVRVPLSRGSRRVELPSFQAKLALRVAWPVAQLLDELVAGDEGGSGLLLLGGLLLLLPAQPQRAVRGRHEPVERLLRKELQKRHRRDSLLGALALLERLALWQLIHEPAGHADARTEAPTL